MVAGREMNASRRLESRKKLWVAELGEVGEEQAQWPSDSVDTML